MDLIPYVAERMPRVQWQNLEMVHYNNTQKNHYNVIFQGIKANSKRNYFLKFETLGEYFHAS